MNEENIPGGRQSPDKKYKSFMLICVVVTISVCLLLTASFVVVFFLVTSSLTGNSTRTINNIEYIYDGEYPAGAEYVTDMMGANVVEILSTGSSTVGSLGTGFVITIDGSNPIALTNYHVVESGSKYYARTVYEDKGYVHEATLLGFDKYHDIAVMKLAAVYKDGSFLDLLDDEEIADFDRGSFFATASTAEYLIAIGNALGDGLSVVDGVCSSSSTVINYIADTDDRSLTKDNKCVAVLQTTAAINSGMSGCPVMNKYGQIVGVGTYTADVDDVSYAVPVEIALAVYEDVVSTRYSSSKQVDLIKHTSGGNTYGVNITYSTDKYHVVNALAYADTPSYRSAPTSATLLNGIGFSGTLLSGRGKESGGLSNPGSATVGLKITESKLTGLVEGNIIVKIGDVELTGQYGNLLGALYKGKVTASTGNEAIKLTLEGGSTVEWKSQSIRVVAK